MKGKVISDLQPQSCSTHGAYRHRLTQTHAGMPVIPLLLTSQCLSFFHLLRFSCFRCLLLSSLSL